MKIKYLAVVYTVFMMLAILLFYHVVSESDFSEQDMVYYNGQLRRVEQALKTKDSNEVEQEYSCHILFLADENYKVHLNKLMQDGAIVFDYYENGEIVGKIVWNEKKQTIDAMQKSILQKGLFIAGLLLLSIYFLLAVVYWYFIRPFQRLQQFTAQIAKGNLDFPLPIQKGNFFGAFTESFDIMREELKRAKDSEYRANRSKKELVAELSHDIKTPISAIKATCEVIQCKEKNEDTLDKVRVIEAKADTVDRLIGNMFHATMEELEILKVEPAEESSLCVLEIFQELKYYGEIIFENEIPKCLLYIDKLRLEQVVDNIVNNSYKYAKTAIRVRFEDQEDGVVIKISDEGAGVPEEEIALITEKFYRGSNTKGKAGSGLGLYLAKMFMEQMGGALECHTLPDEMCQPAGRTIMRRLDGFVVELFIRKV